MKEHNPFIQHIEQLNNDSLLKLLTLFRHEFHAGYYMNSEEGTTSMSDEPSTTNNVIEKPLVDSRNPKSLILDDMYESVETIDNNDIKNHIIRCITELISGFNLIIVDYEKALMNENNVLKQQLMERHGPAESNNQAPGNSMATQKFSSTAPTSKTNGSEGDNNSASMTTATATSGDYASRMANKVRRGQNERKQRQQQQQLNNEKDEIASMKEVKGGDYKLGMSDDDDDDDDDGPQLVTNFSSNRDLAAHLLPNDDEKHNLSATDLPSKYSAENHELNNDEILPGAYSTEGRAFGAYPRMIANAQNVSAERNDNNSQSRTMPSLVREGRPANSNDSDCFSENSAGETLPEVVAYTVDEDLNNRNMRLSVVEQNVRQHIISEAAQAEVVEPVGAFHDKLLRIVFWLVLLMVVIGLFVWLSVGLTTRHNNDPSPSESPSMVPTASPRPVLDTVLEQEKLRCGIGWTDIGYRRLDVDGETTYEGLEVDLCHAVAAAVFNDTNPSRVEISVVTLVERWEALVNRSIDLVTYASTHTMERDVFEETVESGFTFTVPFLYEGIAFGGILPKYVACADKLDTYFGECRGTRICVSEGGTSASVVKDLLPDISIRSVPYDIIYQSLKDKTCNVIADLRTPMARRAKDIDSFTIGNNTFSKEPLSMVTRDDDPQWSDFVNYVFQSLLSAEAQNITQDTSNRFMTTNVFGAKFEYMFINAIKTVGNYAEFYDRNIETITPRKGLNLLNRKGDSGLIYSHPFGTSFHEGPGPVDGGTIQKIVERGYLSCAIMNRTGFGELNLTTNVWSGLDADYCRALSASIFSNNLYNATVFVDLSGTNEEYLALSNGTVDVLTGASLNIVTDVKEPTSGEGFTFSQPYFYGPSDEAFLRALATRQDDPQWSDFVYFVVTSTFYAEENAIIRTNRSSSDMPEVHIFGPDFKNMFQNAILAVGNYGEMYDRNVGQLYPRNGTQNDLNVNPFGPQHYPLPLKFYETPQTVATT